MRRFALPDDDERSNKYTIGDELDNLRDIQKYTPNFAYNYLSLSGNKYCWDNANIERRDLLAYFKVVKGLSRLTIKDLFESSNKLYRFHQISDISRRLEARDTITSLLGGKINLGDMNAPIIGQFGLYTDSPVTPTSKAPRVVFLIGNYGVLHILLLDLHHQIYKSA